MDKFDPGLIQVRIPFRHRDGLFIQVHPCYLGGTPHNRCQGKSSTVAAKIEHSSTFSQPSQPTAVIALVTEEAGFMPMGKVDFVTNAVFAKTRFTHRGAGNFVRGNTFNIPDVTIDLYHFALGAEEFMQNTRPTWESP